MVLQNELLSKGRAEGRAEERLNSLIRLFARGGTEEQAREFWDATDEEIENALGLAHVDFVEDLAEEVTQGGSNFSGGQKQRLSIARAIIAGHDFYLFDDCFSALDMNTEAKVKKNLKRLEGSSILIVSQRISTIMDADEILVMDNGEIIDKGTHSSLIDSCSIYREIVNTQIDQMEAFYDYA
jgi:ATP-binding cassette subfamily B protein